MRGTDASIGLTDLALAVFAAHDLPDGMEPSLDADATYDPVNFSYPHGTHLCAMEVDTETGQSKMRSYVCVDDVGTIVNPLLVEGQIHGGLVQGIAQALWEEAVYDEQGTLVTGSFVDYTLPTTADTISFVTDNTVTPSTNDLGTKGVGEAGTIASTPAASTPCSTPSGTSGSGQLRRARRSGSGLAAGGRPVRTGSSCCWRVPSR
ncbi:molybdopterin cofactor-binding domain-containing protein [Georgenia sp. SUBG003]|uniref:molybdopterin cofactor-binding domain-containing protein n=1 Tax=Georgenia sp. SUBG003 TaxID=1497974 RepID=UPI003AB5DADB